MRQVFFYLLAFLSISNVSIAFLDDNCLFESNIKASYTTGKYINIKDDYLNIGTFSPIFSSDDRILFLDAQGYRFNNGKWAASIGLANRIRLSESSSVGFNLYYDYRRGISTNNFHQAGFGVEWLNDCCDMRINCYLPVSKKTRKTSLCSFDQLGDGFFATRRKIEFAYTGFDAEAGCLLGSYCEFTLYGSLGPYYYQRTHQNHFWGGHCRFEITWKSLLSLQARVSYDRVNSTNVQGLIQISLPLEFFNPSSCTSCCLTNQPVQRNGIILTDHCCNWTWNWNDKN